MHEVSLSIFLALFSSSIVFCVWRVTTNAPAYRKNVFPDAKKRLRESDLLDARIREEHVKWNHSMNEELAAVSKILDADNSDGATEIQEADNPFNRLVPVDVDSHLQCGTNFQKLKNILQRKGCLIWRSEAVSSARIFSSALFAHCF